VTTEQSAVSFGELLHLEPSGNDAFVGTGHQYPWGGLYGGHIVAQALRAAAKTVDGQMVPHSLHAYFIRPGDGADPVRYEVDRSRDGRAFCTRRVVATQSNVILNLEASFHVAEDTPAVQTFGLEPGTPTPDALVNDSWSPMFERRFIPGTDAQGRSRAWFRMRDALDDDPVLHACALAYLSDDLPTDAVVRAHPEGGTQFENHAEQFWSASLDHAIWFHAHDAGEWQLQDFICHRFGGARGLGIGHVFRPDGRHVATVAQEVLLREHRG
jgi:acyl-CoA thioesterase-2